jgi:hypothetical protein
MRYSAHWARQRERFLNYRTRMHYYAIGTENCTLTP